MRILNFALGCLKIIKYGFRNVDLMFILMVRTQAFFKGFGLWVKPIPNLQTTRRSYFSFLFCHLYYLPKCIKYLKYVREKIWLINVKLDGVGPVDNRPSTD